MAQSADDVFIDDDFRFVTVIDRVGPGGDLKLKSGALIPGTLYWDHKPHAVQPKFQLRGPAAKHFFKYGSAAYLHAADGTYTCRLGIESGDDDLINEIGREFMDCDPIDVDQDVVETWNTTHIAADRRKRQLKRVAGPSMGELREREEG